MGHGNQRFSDADKVILTHHYLDPRQSRFTRRAIHQVMSDTAYENHGKFRLGLPADPLA
jgi:hypothetical protein